MDELIDNIPHTCVASSTIHGDDLFAEAPFCRGQVLGSLDVQAIRHADHPRVFDLEWNATS